MATSGNILISPTRNQIIEHAARLAGALRDGESLGNAKINKFNYALNAMVKHWQGKGLKVWTVDEAVLVPQADQTVYTLGPASTDHAARASDFFQTEVSAAGALDGATASPVEDTTNIAVSDHVGIVVDDGTVHWSTVASKTSSQITINAAIDDDASAGAVVFTYTTKLSQPIKIPDDMIRLYDFGEDISTPVIGVARKDFRMLSTPASTGRVSQVFYDKQLSNGRLEIWQTPSRITNYLKFTYWRPIETFETAADNPDLPEEWLLCLGFNLAKIVAPEYGLGEKRYMMVVQQADAYLSDMEGFGREDESIQFGVDMGC
jgi:hypothetical protein